MKSATLRQKFRYRFDNTMSRGPLALIIWLALLSILLIVAVTAVVIIAGIAPAEEGTDQGFFDIAWMGLMRTLDAGTMGGDSGDWPFLFAMLAVTIGGIFVVSTFIGVLTSGIEQKIESLRKGRSFVVEEGHTVILGFTPQLFTIIPELVEANANRKQGACIVILADQDKVEMEDELQAKIPDTKNTRIVCRTGSPIDLADLEIINIHAARSIIVLPPEASDPDSQVIKTILAITNNPKRPQKPYHIVAVLQDEKNIEVARMVGKDEVELILAGDLISRVTVQTCRQSGLSVVHTELLDFGGDEIYYKEEPSLVGKPLSELIFLYEDSSIIGIYTRDRKVLLNPPMDTRIQAGDQVIAISEDDDTIVLSGKQDFGIDKGAITTRAKVDPRPERALILGWNPRGAKIITGLESYVGSGSEIAVVADASEAKDEIAGLVKGLKRQKVFFREADTTDRRVLDSLAVQSYDHIIVLSYSHKLEVQEADARTLITLLHLRDISDRQKATLSIVSEMLDVHNRELADVTRADDFIVSGRLVSLLLSQLSENKHLAALFTDLFDPDGSEIYLKPAEDYVQLGREVNFYTVLASAQRYSEIAIGYRIKQKATDAGAQYGVVTNPEKSGRVTFATGDKIVVVAES